MVAHNADHEKIDGQPVAINMRIGERPILERSLTEGFVSLSSRPVSVLKTAHYAVDCLITHEPPYAAINLELSNIRLIPLTREAKTD